LSKPISLAGGPTRERARHALMAAEFLTPRLDPPVIRHRVRTPLTPIAVRMQILEETRELPEAVRLRSLRRRLTVLDRALSDADAANLDRLAEAETLLHSASHASPLARIGMGSGGSADSGRLPFSERRRREIGGRAFVLARLGAQHRAALTRFLADMLPWRNEAGGAAPAPEQHITRAKLAERHQAAMEILCRAAREISRLYRVYDGGQHGH